MKETFWLKAIAASMRKTIFAFGLLAGGSGACHAQLSYTALPPLTTANYDYGNITVPGGKSLTITAQGAKFGTITVKPEGQLIIKNTTIYMREKIVVQAGPECDYLIRATTEGDKPTYSCAGGELLVQGSTVTAQNQKWQGIEVWGRGNTLPVPTWVKGHVFFTNATVSEAKLAVATYRPGYNKPGGVIRAMNTRFLNNDISIDYQGTPTSAAYYYSPSTGYTMEVPINGLEYFLRCTFDYDANYKAPAAEGHYYNKHISLKEHSKDIRILGCSFDDHYGSIRNCIGVSAIDADFIVDNKYEVTYLWKKGTQTAPSVFNNLDAGVSVLQNVSINRSIVMNSTFTNTDQAIAAVGAFKPIFTGNTISVPSYNGYGSIKQHFNDGDYYVNNGIQLYACTNFSVEYNTISSQYGYRTTKTIGIYTSEAGSQANVIQLNTVRNCNFNYYTFGRNFQYAPFSGSSVGLRFLCNSNGGSKNHDFTVMGGSSTGLRGIAGVQATGSTGSAANIFAAKAGSSYYNFYNQSGANPIRYYKGTGASANPTNIYNITVLNATT